MKKTTVLIFFFLSFWVKGQKVEDIAESFIKKLERASYDSCYAMLDTAFTNKVPLDMVITGWESMPRYIGDYKSHSAPTVETKDNYKIVFITCNFERSKMNMIFTFDDKKIVGLRISPPKNNVAYQYPDYGKPSAFYETKVALKTGTMSLPGVLSVPNNVTNPPVVIFVAGSGPNDKDETIGPNKPLKDLAIGLASNKIASFRYDKRTMAYKEEISKAPEKFGLNDEVINDVLSAVELLKNHPLTKTSKIYVAGHSLGAMCAPLVASRSKNVSGIILLAGNARPLEDLLPEQLNYIFSLDSIDAKEKQYLEKTEQQITIVKDKKKLKEAKSDDLPLGLTSYYWQSIKAYDQVAVAKKLKTPVLVLQGERDYQVTMKDFKLWKDALEQNKKNQFKSYPALNHLFMQGEGRSKPTEYETPANVNEEVITDIVNWIKNN